MASMLFRVLRNILLTLFVIIVFLVGTGLVLAWVYEAEIKQEAVARINEQVAVPIEVGDIDFSLLAHFPYASVQFKDVKIRESYPQSKAQLLEAAEVSLLFNVIDIYEGTYTIKKLYLAHGSLAAKVNTKGEANYEILRPSTGKASQFSLSMEQIRLVEMRVSYSYAPQAQLYRLRLSNADLSGKFTDAKYELGIAVDGMAEVVRVKGIQYLTSKPLKAALTLSIDTKKELYRFKDGQLNLPEMTLQVNGLVQIQPAGIYSDIELRGKELTIQSFLAQLPVEYAQYVSGYSSSGQFDLLMTLKGLSTENRSPAVNVEAGISKGTIRSERYGQDLENVSLRLKYSNGFEHTLKSSSLKISELKATLDNRPITAAISLTDFSAPYLDLDLQTSLDLKQVQRFLPESLITEASGELEANVHLQGVLEQLRHPSGLNNSSASGSIKLSNVHVKTKGYPLDFSGVNAQLIVKEGKLALSSFEGKVGNIALKMNGEILDPLGFISNPKQEFKAELNVLAPYVNLQEFLALTQTDKASKKDTIVDFSISPLLDLRIKASIDRLDFDQFKGKTIKTELSISKEVIRAEYFSVNAMDGDVQGKFSIDASTAKEIYINAEAAIRSVNIHSLFEQCANFGQDVLVAKNLKGDLTASVSFSSVWNKNLTVIPEKIYAKSNVLIENGELNDFDPLLALSNYVDVNELIHLKFATLQNQIVIEDRTIFIPLMNVENNALNMSITGRHTFANDVDYKIRILFSELLRKKLKVKQRLEEFGPVEDDGAGKTTLFLKMTGKATNPKITLDRESMRAKVREDLKQEGQNIKTILSSEFKSIFKGGTAVMENTAKGGADWENDIPKTKPDAKKPVQEKPVVPEQQAQPDPKAPKDKKKNKALQDIENDLNKGEDE